jgi:hypothetical protein
MWNWTEILFIIGELKHLTETMQATQSFTLLKQSRSLNKIPKFEF